MEVFNVNLVILGLNQTSKYKLNTGNRIEIYVFTVSV